MSGKRAALNWLWASGVFVACATAFVGCHKGDDKGGGKQLKLAFVTNNAADFWTIARAGCQKAQEETPGLQFEFQIPPDGTAASQKRIIDDLLAKGLDGLAISPVDPTNETPMLNEVAKQAKLLCVDSDAAGSDRLCYIGTNNVDAGRQAGEMIKQAIPGGGKIMVFVGKLDAQNAHDRYAGIQEALKGSNVQIIDVKTDDTDGVRAKANVADTLVKYPDVACLVGLWSYNGPAILNAVKDANKIGQVKIVAFDEADETLNGVKSGAIFATVVQQPFEFGRQSMEMLAKIINGDTSAIPASKQIFIPTLMITKDKVEDFQAKLAKLLGK